ncbi:Triosephosphate isomerase [uncultured archaeon]|nr:Triosephosphate isomerase [uncultured archaeon]
MASKVKPLIALNLKAYAESSGAAGLELCETAQQVARASGVRIIACPDATLLRQAAQAGGEIFAQEVSGLEPGARTGWTTAEQLARAGVKGSLINHSEHRVEKKEIEGAIARLRANNLESMVCAQDAKESALLAKLKPAYVAVEPPELIGSGISVSTAKPGIVTDTVALIRKANPGVGIICGAGVSTAADVKKAFELGVDGVLLASAYVKAKDPKKLLEDMAAQVR